MPNLAVVANTTLIPVVDMTSVPTNKTINGEVLKTFTSNGTATLVQLTSVQTLANIALDTKANIADLADVAYTGDYSDVLNTPDLTGLATIDQLDSNVVNITNTISGLWANAGAQGTQISAINSALAGIQFRTIGNSKGSAGDTIHMVSFDNTSLYYCTATYTTGAADIWVKTNWTTTGTW